MADSNVPDIDLATRVSEGSQTDTRFRLRKSLGAGGMGEVYLAEDSKLQRQVAIKSIRPDLCKDQEIRKRIERECLLHAKVGPHPHVVTLYDKFEEGDRINLVMEYVDGETLQQMLEGHVKTGTVPPLREALTIAAQCLEALSRIHAHGIVHRDIKPSNIILTRDDAGDVCAKLMDFGIARLEVEDENASRLTQMYGSGPGTPLYMAPEQIDPQTFGPVTAATDVYAMGIMLYQLTSGEPPFSGTLTQIFSGHLHGTPPPLRARAKGRVPDSLVEIVQCALSKQPAQRFPSAKAFREELLRVLADTADEESARATLPAGAAQVADASKTMVASQAYAASGAGSTMLAGAGAKGAEVRRNRALGMAIAAVTFLVAVGGAAAYFVMRPSPNETQATASEAPAPAPSAEVPASAPVAEIPAPAGAEIANVPSVTPPIADTPVQTPDSSMAVVTPDVTAPTPPVVDVAPVVDTSPPPASSGSAMDALLERLPSDTAPAPEPAPATPAATVPDKPVDSAPPPAPAPKPKAPPKKPAPSAESAAKSFAPKETPPPASEPKADSGTSSGGWTVKGSSSYKKE